jgi:hypothetical protein
VFGALSLYRLVTGKSLGLRSFVMNQVYAVQRLGLVIQDSGKVKASGGDYRNIVFLHHSTGANLIEQGQVRDILTENGYQFWDHGYNEIGLRGPDGARLGYHYNIPDDDTNPSGFHRILQQPELALPLNAYSALLQHDVIVMKSCFRPTNNIRSEEQLAQYQEWYLAMRDEMTRHPEKLFILVTAPPLNPAETNAEEAERARRFAEWMISETYLDGHPNIAVYDFYDSLAESDPGSSDYNMLREIYRDGEDSHPNAYANETLGPFFAAFLIEAIESFREANR